MMNQDLNDIFETSTKLVRDELSFSQAHVKAVSTWVTTLSITQLGDTSKALYAALVELSELQCSETLRFDLLQILHPTLENVTKTLEKHVFNQGPINTDRNEQIIELVIQMRKLFAGIYIDIVRRSTEQLESQKFSIFAFHKDTNLRTAQTLAIFYALQQLKELLYHEQMLYSEPLPKQWQVCHYLYAVALSANTQSVNINQLQGTENQLSNIAQAYAQLILLDILNTNQIRQAEIQALYQCSFEWAKKIYFVKKENVQCKYVIHLKKDEPPEFNSNGSSTAASDVIYVVIHNLLEHITATLYRGNDYLSLKEQRYLTPALKFHVQNILGTVAQRQFERFEYSAPLQICFGLLTAHYYLSRLKSFSDTLQLEPEQQTENSTPVRSDFDFYTLERYQNDHYLSREAKLIYRTEVLDISVNGYRIKWVDEVPDHLKTGEFILVKENTHTLWRGGVVRWIRQSTEKSVKVGLEILAQDIFPCAVRIINEENRLNYHPALLMESKNLDQISSTLILPSLPIFKEQQNIYLRLEHQELKLYLLKAQLITQSFIQFEYELIDDQQQFILTDFMARRAADSDHQDL